MKRLLIVGSLLFAGVVLALPGAVGLVAQRQHEQIVRQINTHGDRLAEEHYARGWFSTRTRYRYRIENEQLRKLAARVTGEPESVPELLVNSQIYHGPLPIISGGLDRAILAWTDMESTLVLRSPSGMETTLPGQLQSRIEADGSNRFRYHADAETRALGDGLVLSWNESDLDIVLGRDTNTVAATGDIGLLELSDSDTALQIGPATVKTTQHRGRNGLWTGTVAVHIDRVSLPGFSARGLMLETRLQESSGQATYAIELNADNVEAQGLAGGHARIDLFAQRLDAPALGALVQSISERQGQIPAALRDTILTQLLAAGPEVTLRTFKIPMPGGDIEGEAFISVNPGTGTTPDELSRGAEGNAMLLVPKTLVAKIKATATPEMRTAIDLMMRLRVLKPEGNRYRIEAAYASGLLTVNGFPVPLPRF